MVTFAKTLLGLFVGLLILTLALDINRFFDYREDNRFDTYLALDYVLANSRDSLASLSGYIGDETTVTTAARTAFTQFVKERYPGDQYGYQVVEDTPTSLMYEVRPLSSIVATAKGRFMFGVTRIKLIAQPYGNPSEQQYLLAIGEQIMMYSLFNLSPFINSVNENTAFRFPVTNSRAVLLTTSY